MKVTLEFSDEGDFGAEEMRNARLAMNAQLYKDAFEEVWDKCFRPNNKHGYPGSETDLLNKDSSYEVVEKLIEIYQEINNDLQIAMSE